VSSFGINLDLRLNGQSAVDRAVRGAKSLENIVQRLNSKPLNLANIGGAARTAGGRLGKARQDVIAFAEALNKGEKSFATTEAGLREYVSAFRQLSANTQAGTSTFNTFVGALAKAEKELEDIAHATENARRKALGLLSVEEEAAQLAQKAAQKKAKEDEADARKKNEKAIEKENKRLEKLNRERKREAAAAKRNRGRAIGDLAASVGFPLLFGGGVGSVAGGAAGSLIGSALGIGFGGQILGSALGQGLDQAAQAANQFALEATKGSTSLDTLIQKFGIAGTGSATAIRFAGALGIGAAGRTAAQGSLAGIVGEEGVKSLEKLAESAEDASNAINRFGAATTAKFAPLLTQLNQTVTGLFGGISPSQELDRLTDPNGVGPLPVQRFGPGSAVREEFRKQANAQREARIAELSENPEVKAQLELRKQINKVVSDRIQLARDSARVEGIRLTARRDGLASEQGTLQIQAEQNKLEIIAIQLKNEKNETRIRELELEESLTKEAIKQAKAARANAVLEAKRQIQREQISGAANQITAIRREQRLELEYQQGREGRFALFEAEKKQLDSEFISSGLILDLERKRALIGVTEAERISSINRDYDLRVRLLEREFELNKQNLEQAKAAYDLSRLQVEQALKMERMQAGISAAQQIRATSPFEREAGLLDPFFGDSSQLQVEQTLRYNESLALLNQQLNDVVEQQSKFLAPEVQQQLEDQEKKIRNQIAAFKEYQPAIDAAALAQARFNEAMAITVPVTDAVFDNLLAVAEGTKTAEQAFADFLRSIASMLADAAKQIIATYIAIGIARMFAGVPAKSGPAPDIQLGTGALQGERIMIGGMRTAASGKGTLMNQPYLVGERGPELFVPRSNGTIVPNHQMSAGANVTVNVDASGSSVEGDSDRAEQLGNMLASAVQAELVKQKRPGGLLAS
jgi:hypothetical protein